MCKAGCLYGKSVPYAHFFCNSKKVFKNKLLLSMFKIQSHEHLQRTCLLLLPLEPHEIVLQVTLLCPSFVFLLCCTRHKFQVYFALLWISHQQSKSVECPWCSDNNIHHKIIKLKCWILLFPSWTLRHNVHHRIKTQQKYKLGNEIVVNWTHLPLAAPAYSELHSAEGPGPGPRLLRLLRPLAPPPHKGVPTAHAQCLTAGQEPNN